MVSKLVDKIKNSRLLKHVITLLSGDALVSVLNIVNLLLVINTIGLSDNGKMVIIQTYVLLFNDIFNFQSFNALIKFMSEAIENKAVDKAKFFIKQALFLDITTAIIGTTFGYLLVEFIASFMNWESSIVLYIKIYMLFIIFNITGTAIGVLRFFNEFKVIVLTNLLAGILRTIAYFIGFMSKQEMLYFIIVELFFSITLNISLIFNAYRVLKKNNLNDFFKVKFYFHKEFFMFNLYNNLVLVLDIPRVHLSSLIISKVLGFSEVSILKVIDKICNVISKLGSPINQVIYPELSMMIAKNKFQEAKKLAYKITFGISSIGIAGVLLLGFVSIFLGNVIEDVEIYRIPLLIGLTAAVLGTSSISIHNLFTALGLVKYDALIALVVNVFYIFVLLFFVKAIGVSGVYITNSIQVLAFIGVKVYLIKKLYKNRELSINNS